MVHVPLDWRISGWQFCAGYSLYVSVGSGGTTSVLSGSGSGCWTMFAYPTGDCEKSVRRRATLFHLNLWPLTSNTYDLGNACLTVLWRLSTSLIHVRVSLLSNDLVGVEVAPWYNSSRKILLP